VASAAAILGLSFALVGLAVGLGARYPRFGADPSQVAGSYGGVAFMVEAVMLVIVMIALVGWPSSLYLTQQLRGRPLTSPQQLVTAGCVVTALVLSAGVWLASMRSGVSALDAMSD